MNIRPLGNRVLVKPTTAEQTTSTGIVLPDSAEKERKAQGVIVALGTGDPVVKSGLKLGDLVVFGKYSGDDIEVDEGGKKVEYKALSVGGDKDEVLAVIEK